MLLKTGTPRRRNKAELELVKRQNIESKHKLEQAE